MPVVKGLNSKNQMPDSAIYPPTFGGGDGIIFHFTIKIWILIEAFEVICRQGCRFLLAKWYLAY